MPIIQLKYIGTYEYGCAFSKRIECAIMIKVAELEDDKTKHRNRVLYNARVFLSTNNFYKYPKYCNCFFVQSLLPIHILYRFFQYRSNKIYLHPLCRILYHFCAFPFHYNTLQTLPANPTAVVCLNITPITSLSIFGLHITDSCHAGRFFFI